MQTLSSMRRNSTYKKNLIPFRWIVFFIVYQLLASLFIYLTPLIGFMFCYLIFAREQQEIEHEEDSLMLYLSFAYLIFIDVNKGFYLFSGLIFFALFYRIFTVWLETSFKCKNCIIFVYVAVGYIGIYGINNLIAYALNQQLFNLGWEYAWYIFSDFIIAVVVFRDKIL